MDWNLKTPAWDLEEFNQETISNINVIDGSSSFGGQGTKGDFSVDLKLGRVSNSGDESGDKLKEPGVSKLAPSPSGSSKRARAANNATQRVSCLVDGCISDLSKCREYHRRHKVCELHSKTPQVTIGGYKQRFCQQCSRFHSLEEFDEGKRSCRKRLDGHNRRRRKPQPEPVLHSGSYMSNYQGPRLLPFSSSNLYPSTSAANPTWPGAVKTMERAELYNQQPRLNLLDKHNPFSESSSSSYREGKQFTLLQGENSMFSNNTAPETSVCQPLLKSIASSQSGGSSHRVFSDGLTNRVPDSDCALSLLSSPPMHKSGISLSHIAQPLVSSQQYNSLESMDSVLVPNASNANIHCQGFFQMGPDESSNNDDPQTLPFYWD